MKKVIIIVGGIGVLGLSIGYYLYKTQNKLDGKDFDSIVGLSKNKGYDIFEGLSANKLDTLKKNYLKKFNRISHNEFINLLSLGENKWTDSQKNKFNNYWSKII